MAEKPTDRTFIGKLSANSDRVVAPLEATQADAPIVKEVLTCEDGRSVRLVSGDEDAGGRVLGNKCSLSHLVSDDKKSSQTEEDDDEGVYHSMAKKQKLSDEEGAEDASKIMNAGLEQIERRRDLAFMHVKGFNLDSGFSSYSSGHESIPSPVDSQNHILSQQQSQGSSILGGTEPLMLGATSSQLAFSLSRDFYNCDKTSYSDSETYRRSSTKCVVNRGEANAIIKRTQGVLLHTETKELLGQLEKAKDLEVKYAEQKEEDRLNNLCIICLNEPKDSAFVHSLALHICCCYKCAIKVWNKKKRCPICNCKVKNVLKCYVH